MHFETLEEATRRYRLRNSKMSNSVIALHLGVHEGQDDVINHSSLSCSFTRNGDIVAIRTKHDEVAIFHVFQSVQAKMAEIADRILD